MDPFSSDGELANLHAAFHTGQFKAVVAYSAVDQVDPANKLRLQVLQLRARIALGEGAAVAKELAGAKEVDLQAVRLFAEFVTTGKGDDAAEALAESNGDNETVEILAGTILARQGREKEALVLLGKHQGSLDAVALIVQIYLAINRNDLAAAEVRKARGWAQDHLIVNLAEAWVGLREGGQKYQPAFYVFEELATAPPALEQASNTRTLLSQAVCELHLGRHPEAEAALEQCLKQDPEDAEVLANAVALYTVAGKREQASEALTKLESVAPQHVLVQDLSAKKSLFDTAATKYASAATTART